MLPCIGSRPLFRHLQPAPVLEKSLEKRFGMAPARWLERIGKRFFKHPTSDLQVSAYYAWDRKQPSVDGKTYR
jgi:hypothetical protein